DPEQHLPVADARSLLQRGVPLVDLLRIAPAGVEQQPRGRGQDPAPGELVLDRLGLPGLRVQRGLLRELVTPGAPKITLQLAGTPRLDYPQELFEPPPGVLPGLLGAGQVALGLTDLRGALRPVFRRGEPCAGQLDREGGEVDLPLDLLPL